MNQYDFSLAACPPDTSDAPANAACASLCRRLGLLALASEWWDARTSADVATTSQTKVLQFLSGYRLPDSLEVGVAGTALSSGALLVAVGMRTMSDAQMTDQLTNFDKNGVSVGDFICAIVPVGADISNSLSNEIVIRFGAAIASAGSLVFGISNFTQREGGTTLENPFAAACGFANFGNPDNFVNVSIPVAQQGQLVPGYAVPQGRRPMGGLGSNLGPAYLGLPQGRG